MVWEIVVMVLLLKIPIVYLCVVVWYAIQDEPDGADPAGVVAVADTPSSGGGSHWTKRRGLRRHGHPRPPRRPARVSRGAAPTRAGVRP